MLTNIYQNGDVVDGRFRVLNALGMGGMGGVFLVEQLNFGRQVALKVLHKQSVDDARSRERFTREARAICHLQHPNLVVYHDFGADKATGRLFLAMEYLQGRSLGSLLKLAAPIPIDRVAHILAQLCGALSEAHRAGVIHRDLKPSNVMLVRRGVDTDFVKLIDFGISRVLSGAEHHGQSEVDLTEAGMIIGTTAYLAPEYIRSQVVDQRVDIYALGVMTHELIAGQRPFQAADRVEMLAMHLNETPMSLEAMVDGRQVPTALSDVVLKALAKDPNQRFDTVEAFKTAFLEAVAPLLEEEAVGATIRQPIPDGLLVGSDNINLMTTDALPMESENEASTQHLNTTIPRNLGTEPTLSHNTPQPLPGRSRPRLPILGLAGVLVAVTVGLIWTMGGFQSQPPNVPALPEVPVTPTLPSVGPQPAAVVIEQPAGEVLVKRRQPASEGRWDENQPPAVESTFVVRKAAGAPQDTPKRRALREATARAERAKRAADWRSVDKAYREAHKISPSARFLKEIGQAQIKLGNMGEACRYFQRYVKRLPSKKRADAIERFAVYGCNLSL